VISSVSDANCTKSLTPPQQWTFGRRVSAKLEIPWDDVIRDLLAVRVVTVNLAGRISVVVGKVRDPRLSLGDLQDRV
jgi:hypothetical protein